MIQDLVIGLAQGGIYALTGVGLVRIFSVVRVPNFAHGEPVMVGAMLTLTLVASAGLPIASCSTSTPAHPRASTSARAWPSS